MGKLKTLGATTGAALALSGGLAACSPNTAPASTPCPAFAEATPGSRASDALPQSTGAERAISLVALPKLFGEIEGSCEAPQQAVVQHAKYLGHSAIVITENNPMANDGILSEQIVVADKGAKHEITTNDILSATLVDEAQTVDTQDGQTGLKTTTIIEVASADGTWDVTRRQPGLPDVVGYPANGDATQQDSVKDIMNNSFEPFLTLINEPYAEANAAPFGAPGAQS